MPPWRVTRGSAGISDRGLFVDRRSDARKPAHPINGLGRNRIPLKARSPDLEGGVPKIGTAYQRAQRRPSSLPGSEEAIKKGHDPTTLNCPDPGLRQSLRRHQELAHRHHATRRRRPPTAQQGRLGQRCRSKTKYMESPEGFDRNPGGLRRVSQALSRRQNRAEQVRDALRPRQLRTFPIEGHRRGASDAQHGAPTSMNGATISTDLETAVTSGLFDDKLLV